jgi:predicted phosphate transport protein (TIGR00153 family)
MRFRLVPTDDRFFDLFCEAAANSLECARRLQELVGDLSNVQEKHQLVLERERQGDQLTRDILHRLDATFVTPFDREDIHALAERLDDVVDDMFAVSDLLQLVRPAQLLPELAELATILVRMGEETVELMKCLQTMKGAKPRLDAIDELESEGDAIYRRTMARLFSGEFEALEVLKWKDIVQAMEDSLNTVEDVSQVVESIVLKHA